MITSNAKINIFRKNFLQSAGLFEASPVERIKKNIGIGFRHTRLKPICLKIISNGTASKRPAYKNVDLRGTFLAIREGRKG